MLATFVIETCLLAYTVWRYKLSPVMRVTVATLGLLATFQLAEYYVCGGMGVSAATWSRIGFAAITFLPPLGIHLVHLLAQKSERLLVYVAYAAGVAWMLVFATGEWAFSGHVCGGNYVIFQLRPFLTPLYALFYYGWLVAGIWLAASFARRAIPKVKTALMTLILGYFVFLIPTSTANIIKPETMSGIPSIMCGFAVFFALILVLKILPLVATKHDMRKH